ncbi:carbon-nitrogen hydrolase family protein [Lacisediminihabitans sp.]|uniref:carbon-nitrogen hydrolase family protein n=1 Tax=Lacisediminihabitans sp. TaxID=2787631 RepID=UPI00374D263E
MTESGVSGLGSHGDSSVGVAVAQFAPGDDTAANLASIRDLATLAVERGASLVVFPEYSSYFTPDLGAHSLAAAEPLDGPFVAGLEAIAKVLGVHLVAGMLEKTAGGDRFSNTVVAVGPTGAIVAAYRKIHLYDAFGQRESEWVRPGDIEAPETFPLAGFTVGIQTCYDLRFPEVTRRLVDAGADLVVVPSEWVRGPLKEQHWRTLVTARALENTIFVAAADQAPPIGAGNSMIVDPMGVELATLGEETSVAVAWLARSRIESVREINPALRMRRFGVHPL